MPGKKRFTIAEARQIGEALGADWTQFDVGQYRMGLDVALEHGARDLETNVTNDDPMVTGKIALAHLKEFADYYGSAKWRRRPSDIDADAEIPFPSGS